MSTLHVIHDRLPTYYMDNTQNTEQMFTDENHDFIKLYNGNANCNDEIEIHDDSLILMMIPFVYITLQTKLLKQSEMKQINYPYFL